MAIQSCVGKGKYLATLQQQAAAQSELTSTQLDLLDAQTKVADQEVLIAALRTETARLDQEIDELSDQSKGEQLQMGSSLNLAQEKLSKTTAELQLTKGQLNTLLDYNQRKSSRLSSLFDQMNIVLASVPSTQVSTSMSSDAFSIQFSEGLFFVGSGNKLSDYGTALIQKLAAVLGGQGDLIIDITAFPAVAAGTLKSWESASKRANLIAFELVTSYGLSPKQVNAIGKQGELIIVNGAPAESKQRKTVELGIRLNPANYPLPALAH